MELGLTGRSVLITGSSKGIGLACAHAFAAEGCDLHLIARTAADLESARGELRDRHQVQVTTHALDLSDSTNVDRLVEAAGDVDILVNNAGAIPGGSIEAVDEARWREGWDLKVYGYINMTRAFLTLSPDVTREAHVYFRPVGAYAGGNGPINIRVKHRWMPILERASAVQRGLGKCWTQDAERGIVGPPGGVGR